MAGFPSRVSHQALGGNRENVLKVTDPKKQLDVAKWNAVQWQVAGMNRVAPLVTLTIAADGSRTSGAEAWNDLDAAPLRVTITHSLTGVYVITAAATYPDENGVAQAVEFHGAIITAISATSVRPPTFTLDSATQITVYTWNAAGAATDMPFTVDIK